MNATINHTTASARLAIAGQLPTIQTLLRLLDPSAPFQPILVGSIDLVAWQAFFGQAVEVIEEHLPQALSPLPQSAQKKVTAAASTLFSLAHSICDAPQVHISEQAAELDAFGQLPECMGLYNDPMRPDEERELIDKARTASIEFQKRTAGQPAVHYRALEESAHTLITALTRRHGLLWLLRRKLKTSPRFKAKFQGLADHLKLLLASPPPSKDTPWKDARIWFARLAATVDLHLMPKLDALLRATASRKRPLARSRSHPSVPTRKSIKDAFLHAWDSFLQAYTTVQHGFAAQDAHALWALFSGIIDRFTSTLIAHEVHVPSIAISASTDRIVEGIARLDVRILARPLLTAWDQTLVADDDYALQIILAGLHHLERVELATEGRQRVIYDFSEGTMARWLSQGTYAGVNPDREASARLDTETRRARRTLEHLRRHQAAFHERRNWTPLPQHIATTASNRLWIINPLLAVHPRIIALVALYPPATAASNQRRDTRQRPSRRARGKRGKL